MVYILYAKRTWLLYSSESSHTICPLKFDHFFSVQQQNAFGNRSSQDITIRNGHDENFGDQGIVCFIRVKYITISPLLYLENTHMWRSRERYHLGQCLHNHCMKWVHIIYMYYVWNVLYIAKSRVAVGKGIIWVSICIIIVRNECISYICTMYTMFWILQKLELNVIC